MFCLLAISAALIFFVWSRSVSGPVSFEYAFKPGAIIMYDVTVESLNMKEFKYLDKDEVAGVEKTSQKKTYTLLVTVLSVLTNGDFEVQLGISGSEVLNTTVEIGDKETIDTTRGKEKEGELCRVVVTKNGEALKFLPAGEWATESKTASVRNLRKRKYFLEKVIVPVVKGTAGESIPGAGKFTRHPLEGKVLEYKGKDRGYKDAKGKAGIIFEAEGSSFCRTSADEDIKKNEELEVRETKTVCFDGSAGILASQNYNWVFEDRYDASHARIKEVQRISVQVNVAR